MGCISIPESHQNPSPWGSVQFQARQVCQNFTLSKPLQGAHINLIPSLEKWFHPEHPKLRLLLLAQPCHIPNTCFLLDDHQVIALKAKIPPLPYGKVNRKTRMNQPHFIYNPYRSARFHLQENCTQKKNFPSIRHNPESQELIDQLVRTPGKCYWKKHFL